ncbi:MAG: hypothetical protein V4699_01845 [Patescibacteria group bacterium]
MYGLDPTKKETTPGVSDSVAIEKLSAQGESVSRTKQKESIAESLTQTDEFSRELFAIIATANQNGAMDQATIDSLAATLAEKIQNPVIRKVFLLSDLKISANEDATVITNYKDAFISVQKIYTVDYTVYDVLQKFMADENNVDLKALLKLDPIIAQTNKVIGETLKMTVPQSLSTLHLNFINSLERLLENLQDIKLFDADPIIAFGAISQYIKNAGALEVSSGDLRDGIQQKLSN